MTVTRDWYLEVDGVPLATHGWEVYDLSPLLDDPDLLGSDRVIPGAGVRAYPRVPTVTVITLALDVFGEVDEDDAPYDDPMTGLVTNFDYLKATIGQGAAADGTVSATFHRGSLDPAIGPVTFLGFKGSSAFGDANLRTTFDLSIPAGALVVTGS